MTQFTFHQRAHAHTAITNALRRLKRDDYELAARADVERPDGWPSGGGSHAPGVSDPTGNTVVKRDPKNEDGRAKNRPATHAIELMMQAAALLAQADSLRAAALPPAKAEEPDTWCTNCEKSGVMTARGDEKAVGKESTLCSWCHAFNREHSQLPPRALVRKHGRGDRIFDRDIVQALQAAKAG